MAANSGIKDQRRGRKGGKGGTKDQPANGEIRNVIFWQSYGGLRGRVRMADKEETAREGGRFACGERC